MTPQTPDLTPSYIRYVVRLIRPFPDFDWSFMKPIRQKAVALLHLKRGDRVLDMGCGPGGSFPYLIDAVGPSGEVLGVEISTQITVNARARIRRNKWGNITVTEGAAQTVDLPGIFDGLLMFAAPDIYASPEALANILPNLRENARVVVFGAQLSRHRLGKRLNPFLGMLFKLSFSTTPRPDHQPLRCLEMYVKDLEKHDYFLGLMFLASATVVRDKVQ